MLFTTTLKYIYGEIVKNKIVIYISTHRVYYIATDKTMDERQGYGTAGDEED